MQYKQYTYHAQTNELVEKAWPHPDIIESIQHLKGTDYYAIRLNEYEDHIKSLLRTPCAPECKQVFKDGQEYVERKDYEIQQWCKNKETLKGIPTFVQKHTPEAAMCPDCYLLAYPIQQQESEDELYDEIETIFDKHTAPTGGGYEADYTDRNGFINELIKTFQLTRRKQ